MENTYAQRIESLRSLMRTKGWDAVILTGSDPHGSEYPAERWKQVQWLTGFTGEAGDVVVTLDHAGLWTDTRYFIQANRQLAGTGVVLHKTRVPDQVLIPEWLASNFDDDVIIAVDGLCVSAGYTQELPGTVVSVPDILNAFWEDRPGIPQTPVFTVDPGEDRQSKLAFVRSFIRENNAGAMLLSALDDIAWVLNVRASDIEYNPLVISYLLVTGDSAEWFVLKEDAEDPDTAAAFDELESAGIALRRYDEIDLAVSEYEGRILLDAGSVNFNLWHLCGGETVLVDSPVKIRKAVKNPVEIENMRATLVRDGVAMEKFLYWLEMSIADGVVVNEWDASVKLGQLRSELPGYRGDSFETISAYGPGAALPHYVTPRENSPVLEAKGLYLCDSGGQFDTGTTDITRTVPLGECTELEKEDYTLVLKGHIDLAMAVFPRGTSGCQIDALSREPLWRHHRNFGHGTGHGIGYFLGVHEGPQDIRQNFNRTPLQPGMFTSNEPGLYRENMHGIRHENLILTVRDGVDSFAEWYRFETVTLCHFDTSAIIPDLLDKDEKEWLNAYNERVYRTLCPYLPEAVCEWLREKTEPID
ncbi:MAG: aminopeptidase P family protein [Bacteroidales bacterium]|nr:aminopeptidase P family protein [Bacteroidales bacterium]